LLASVALVRRPNVEVDGGADVPQVADKEAEPTLAKGASFGSAASASPTAGGISIAASSSASVERNQDQEERANCSPKSSCDISEFSQHDFVHLADLGNGACGTVTKVAHVKTRKTFALKAIERSHVVEHKLEAYVEFEVETQRNLKHPNIVRLHGSFEDSERVYLLMEYAVGGQLFSRIRRERYLAEDKARSMFTDVVSALVYLHGNSIAHRDLKPENVLLFQKDVAKLADFGWCATLSGDGRRTFCGTPDYLSPEMLTGKPHDHNVDVWAAGVLLYEMLTGKAPFAARSTVESMQRIISADLQPPQDPPLPASALAIIQGLLRVDAEDRTELKEVLEHPWIKPKEGRSSDSAIPRSCFVAESPKALGSSAGLAAVDGQSASSAQVAKLQSPASSPKAHLVSAVVQSNAPSPKAKSLSAKVLSPAASPKAQSATSKVQLPASVLRAPFVTGADQCHGQHSSPEGKGEACPRFPAPHHDGMPKIGGLSSLEGLDSKPTQSAVSPGWLGLGDNGLESGDGRSSSASSAALSTSRSFFGNALRPCHRGSGGSTSTAASSSPSSEAGNKGFILASCLRPVSERFTDRGQQGKRGSMRDDVVEHAWASAARPMQSFDVLPAGTPSSESSLHAMKASNHEPPLSWRETNTFTAVRSWVRTEAPRRSLSDELDSVIEDPASMIPQPSSRRCWSGPSDFARAPPP